MSCVKTFNINSFVYNILVIGNGFDLYHGLPTKYEHFLDFIKIWDEFYLNYKNEISKKDTTEIPEYIKIDIENSKDTFNIDKLTELSKYANIFNIENMKQFDELIKSNCWIDYFLNSNYKDKGWIDFEYEIEQIINCMKEVINHHKENNDIKTKPELLNKSTYYYQIEKDLHDKIKFFPKYFKKINDLGFSYLVSSEFSNGNKVNIKELRKNLKSELDDLIACLNIYLLEFIDKLYLDFKSDVILDAKIDKVINFNYTDTYKKLYLLNNDDDTVHHIHGRIGPKNNMVLGMKSPIEDDEDFLYFHKDFQRNQKNTGINYIKWLNKSIMPSNKIYVLGHSLGSNDSDIFNEIFTASSTKEITIFYRDENESGRFLENLYKIFNKEKVSKWIKEGFLTFTPLE